MAQLFEYCFYLGLLLVLTAALLFIKNLVTGRFRKWALPLGLLVLGSLLVAGPAVLSRTMAVDLGPREEIVNTERHLSLTGWDRQNYDFLAAKQDTVVLQMGNPDVTDETLNLLAKMQQLRELDLNDSAITDKGLEKLAALPALTTLRLRGTRITDAGFRQHLAPLSNLQNLDLRQTAVTPETVEQWKAAQPSRRAFQ